MVIAKLACIKFIDEMDNTLYILASKQSAAMKKLEVLSNNMANVTSAGFKEDKVLFDQYMHYDKLDATSMTAARASITDFTQGSISVTNNDLDVALVGRGFFVVETPQGAMYTRNGAFQINADGVLVSGDGFPVLSADNQQIVFEEDDMNPIITEQGTVFVGNAERGAVGVVDFENLNELKKIGNSLFKSENPPQEAENYKVLRGSLETSNVNSINSIAQLAQIEKEVSQTTHMINENLNMHRNAYKVYSKVGG